MQNRFTQYAANRDAVLQQIIATLSVDTRFVAAWLEGSFGRGEEDELSDLDLYVVVADAYAEDFCTSSPEATTKISSNDRFALFSQFGDPLVLREDRSFKGSWGCFNHVSYRKTATVIDWVFLPQAKAQRPLQSRVLFEQVDIPIEPSPGNVSLEQRVAIASNDVGLFWLMTTVTIKYMLRQDTIAFYGFISAVYWALQNVIHRLAGEGWKYQRMDFKLAANQKEQVEMIWQLCNAMLELMPRVSELGGYVPDDPMSLIEVCLALAEK